MIYNNNNDDDVMKKKEEGRATRRNNFPNAQWQNAFRLFACPESRNTFDVIETLPKTWFVMFCV